MTYRYDDTIVVYTELWQGEAGVEAQQILRGELFCGELVVKGIVC